MSGIITVDATTVVACIGGEEALTPFHFNPPTTSPTIRLDIVLFTLVSRVKMMNGLNEPNFECMVVDDNELIDLLNFLIQKENDEH